MIENRKSGLIRDSFRLRLAGVSFWRRSRSRTVCCVWPQASLVSSSLGHPSNCPWPSQPWHLWKEQPSFVGSPKIWVYQVWHICQGQHRCDVMCVFLIASYQMACGFSLSPNHKVSLPGAPSAMNQYLVFAGEVLGNPSIPIQTLTLVICLLLSLWTQDSSFIQGVFILP